MKHTALPIWARKPVHAKEVVVTPRGWMVKDTGEMLKLVRNLDTRLRDLKVEIDQIIVPEDKPDVEVTTTVSDSETTTVANDDVVIPDPVVTEEKPAPKRRGRPRKQAATES